MRSVLNGARLHYMATTLTYARVTHGALFVAANTRNVIVYLLATQFLSTTSTRLHFDAHTHTHRQTGR